MILLDTVVEVLTLPDPDRLEPTSRAILQTALGITRQDGFPIGLAAVDNDPLGRPCRLSALRRKRLADARFRRSLNQNSTVSPLLSMARYKYIQHPLTLR